LEPPDRISATFGESSFIPAEFSITVDDPELAAASGADTGKVIAGRNVERRAGLEL